MTVALNSIAPVNPISIPGTAHLAFDATATADTQVDVDYSIVFAPGITFDNGTPYLSTSGKAVGVRPTTVALDAGIRSSGQHYANFIVHADVKERGVLQFHVAWTVPVVTSTGATGAAFGIASRPKANAGPKGRPAR